MPFPIDTLERLEHLTHTFDPIVYTEFGKFNSVIEVNENVLTPILVTPSGIVTLVSPLQP
jgi:hypothetical protein